MPKSPSPDGNGPKKTGGHILSCPSCWAGKIQWTANPSEANGRNIEVFFEQPMPISIAINPSIRSCPQRS